MSEENLTLALVLFAGPMLLWAGARKILIALGPSGRFSREKEPLLFWINIASSIVIAALGLIMTVCVAGYLI